VLAEISCPRRGCDNLLAQLLRDGEARLAVRHRVVGHGGPLDRPEHGGHLETRDLQPPVPVDRGPQAETAQLWVCPCRDVRCGTVFVLDVAQLRHVLGYVHRRRTPLRWCPDAAAVERSRRLWVLGHRLLRPGERAEPVGAPPPIARGDLRPIRALRPGAEPGVRR